ncbi:putative regulator [Pseudonocardia sp. N23]|nr:putative regulator [Pseudonocardia sp. N23]
MDEGPEGNAAWLPAAALAAVTWRKATASNPSGDCVEVAVLPDGDVAVRNSRAPHGPALVYTRAEIAAFVAGVRGGEFDDLTC